MTREIENFLKTLSRSEIIERSLENFGCILLADDLESAVEAANVIASEHLELMVENPFEVMTRIRNASAIFLGPYSSEPLGDYFPGPDHILAHQWNGKILLPSLG